MSHPYQDASRPVDERASDLLSRMTFEEKAAQMHALWLILSEDGQHRPRQDDFTGRHGSGGGEEGAAPGPGADLARARQPRRRRRARASAR